MYPPEARHVEPLPVVEPPRPPLAPRSPLRVQRLSPAYRVALLMSLGLLDVDPVLR